MAYALSSIWYTVLPSGPCFSDQYKSNVSPFVSLHISVKLAKAFLVFFIWHILIFINILVTWSLCIVSHNYISYTPLYTSYSYLYEHTHTWITVVWWGLTESLYLCPFQRGAETAHKRPGEQQKRKAGDSLLSISQPTKLHLSEKKIE